MAIGLIGDFRSDAVGFIGALPTMTPAKANNLVNGLETLIKQRARDGVMDAVPALKKQALKIVIPLAAASALSLAISLVALRRSRHR